MNNFFELEPEVAGGLGPHTVMDRNTHPPRVAKLHYQFDGWRGDHIVTSFPCFLVTEPLANKLLGEQLRGLEIADVEVSTSEELDELFPEIELPKFLWLKATGVAGVDDSALHRTKIWSSRRKRSG